MTNTCTIIDVLNIIKTKMFRVGDEDIFSESEMIIRNYKRITKCEKELYILKILESTISLYNTTGKLQQIIHNNPMLFPELIICNVIDYYVKRLLQ